MMSALVVTVLVLSLLTMATAVAVGVLWELRVATRGRLVGFIKRGGGLLWWGAVVSSALLLAFVGLWVRSYWHGDQVGYRVAGADGVVRTALASYSGRLALSQDGRVGAPAQGEQGWFLERRFAKPGYDMNGGFAGVEYRRVNAPGRGWLWEVRAPMWWVTVVLAAAAGAQFIWWRRWHRRATAGLCRTCGYDLRATPERCPECGTAGLPVGS